MFLTNNIGFTCVIRTMFHQLGKGTNVTGKWLMIKAAKMRTANNTGGISNNNV